MGIYQNVPITIFISIVLNSCMNNQFVKLNGQIQKIGLLNQTNCILTIQGMSIAQFVLGPSVSQRVHTLFVKSKLSLGFVLYLPHIHTSDVVFTGLLKPTAAQASKPLQIQNERVIIVLTIEEFINLKSTIISRLRGLEHVPPNFSVIPLSCKRCTTRNLYEYYQQVDIDAQVQSKSCINHDIRHHIFRFIINVKKSTVNP